MKACRKEHFPSLICQQHPGKITKGITPRMSDLFAVSNLRYINSAGYQLIPLTKQHHSFYKLFSFTTSKSVKTNEQWASNELRHRILSMPSSKTTPSLLGYYGPPSFRNNFELDRWESVFIPVQYSILGTLGKQKGLVESGLIFHCDWCQLHLISSKGGWVEIHRYLNENKSYFLCV